VFAPLVYWSTIDGKAWSSVVYYCREFMFEFNEAARFEEPCNDDRKAWLIGSFEIDSVAMLQLF